MMMLLYILFSAAVAVYSYTQIDLNLTLSSHPTYQSIQQKLIYLGYFDRQTSSVLFVFLVGVLFVVYGLIIAAAYRGRMSLSHILVCLACTGILGVCAYPAFSHDMFNYMFDAKIVTTYGSNPYTHSAMDFSDDVWTRFMHWTHRTYPYGPIWLLVTIPFSFLGFGKFVLTLFLFKGMFLLFHIGILWCIWKLSHKKKVAVLMYALNPLVWIESLVSPHNEVVMISFLLFSFFFLQRRSPWLGYVMFFLSVGVKFVTGILFPLVLFFPSIQKKYSAERYYLFSLFLLFIPLIAEIWQREPYTWYMLPLLAVGSLATTSVVYIVIQSTVSVGLLLRYYPYVKYGEYGPQTVYEQHMITLGMLVCVSVTFFLWVWRVRKGRFRML